MTQDFGQNKNMSGLKPKKHHLFLPFEPEQQKEVVVVNLLNSLQIQKGFVL